MRSCSRLPFALALATFTVAALCAGTALAEVIPVQGSTGEAGIALRSQGVDGVEIHYEMGQFAMEPLTIEGVACQKLILPGNFLPNDAGAPDLPGISRYIALPQGAVANLQVTALHTQVFQDVEISPAPVIPRDTEDEIIYRWNAEIYERDAFYPQTAVRVSEPTQIRGVDAVIVGITPFVSTSAVALGTSARTRCAAGTGSRSLQTTCSTTSRWPRSTSMRRRARIAMATST
jgi:hypothetical protein